MAVLRTIWRDEARRKQRSHRHGVHLTRLVRSESRTVNGAFESRGCQSFIGLLHLLGIIENADNDRFYFRRILHYL